MSLAFLIGPFEHYTIPEPLLSWQLINGIPSCASCNKQLNLVFDVPPETGTASCKCDGEHERSFLKEGR